MRKTQPPSNFLKHTTQNPFQRLLINNFYSTLVSLIKPLEPKTIMDVGCGEGFSLKKLKTNGIGKELIGIESSKTAIALGKKLFPNLKIKWGSVYKLPYKEKSFDLVLCTEVLEHLEKPSLALHQVLKVSKKYVILSVPNEPFFMLSNFLRGKYIARFGNHPEHIQHWSIFSFQSFLNENGVKIKQLKLPFPWIMALGEKA